MKALRMVAAVLAAAMLAAAPPAKFTAEQIKTVRQWHELQKVGLEDWKAGKRKEAMGPLGQALEIGLRLVGRWHRGTETTAFELGYAWQTLGEWEKEAECHRIVIEARRRLDGEGHWRTVDARLALAEALAQAKRTPKQREALVRTQELNGSAVALYKEARFKEALPLLHEALKLAEETLGKRHPLYAMSLNNLAMLLRDMGDRKAALPLFREALGVHGEALGRRHPGYAISLSNLAALLRDMGDQKAALPLFRQALAIQKEALGEWHPDYAVGLNNLARLLSEMGAQKAALPLLREALEVHGQALGKRHPRYATILSSLAALLWDMGDRKAALPLFREALEVQGQALGKRHPDYAISLSNLAMLLHDMGDHKAALPLMREALRLHGQALGKRHPGYVTNLNNLAALLHGTGDMKAALPLHREALKLREEVLGKRHPHYAISLNGLAMLLQEMGDMKAALPLFREALEVTGETLGKRHPEYATSLNNLASLLRKMGDMKAALPLYREALKLREEVLGKRHPHYAISLNGLAMLLQDMGDSQAALPLADEALGIVSSALRDNASVLSDRQQLAAADSARPYLDNRLTLPDLGKHPSAAAHVLAWKGQVLLRQQQRRLFLRLDRDPKAKPAAEALLAATRRLAALRSSPAPTRERLAEAEKEQEQAQARLAGLSADYRKAREEKPVSPEDLAKTLPEGAVLVDYHFYGTKLAAFLHRRGKQCVRVELGKAAPVEEAVAEWRTRLVSGKPDSRHGAALRKLLLDPLAKHLTGATVLLVSPDGVLGTVPFAALPGKTKGAYLVEEVAVAVVPVPGVLPDLLAPVKKADRLGASLLVAGELRYDPAKDAPAPAAGEDHRSAPRTGRERFAALPATKAETAAVEGAFRRLFKAGAVVSLREGEATKKAVREHLPKARYAHLATHGWFAPEEVKGALSGEKPAAPGERREPVGWHPLLLSGLALSDANREPKPGEEDGILTALEVSEMDLTRLELAVLSACETGLGKVAGGEGILGMQRAFQAAGARSVVASLWSVDDEATRHLMSDFYSLAWDEKKPLGKGEALRQAQLAMLFGRNLEGKPRGAGKVPVKLPEGGKDRLPPYYWAAFVLSGDWR
ncbi:MAG: tetratricopeptide repeat protein [Gemmataceae bacterium]|nr:tetratricopeptide repeat protein [Gemmataceae bacterium]